MVNRQDCVVRIQRTVSPDGHDASLQCKAGVNGNHVVEDTTVKIIMSMRKQKPRMHHPVTL